MKYLAGQPVSVGYVCRNKAKELAKVIPSLAASTVRPDLVILSDDGSDDGSPEVFTRTCEAHGLKSAVISPPETGRRFRINSLRNAAIRAAPDGLVIMLDADLMLARTGIEAHQRMHLAHPGDKLVTTGPRLEFATADAVGPVNFLWGFECVGQVSAPGAQLPNWQVTPGSMMAMTRRAVELVGWFDEGYDGYYGYDDVDFMIRADQMGFEFRGDWEAHVIHIPHPRSKLHADSTRNAERFHQKHGLRVEYPSIIRALSRKPWNEVYQDLLANKLPSNSVPTLPLDDMSGRVMLEFAAKKAVRRVLSTAAGLLSWKDAR
jgi:glycosyltransferase involved in cell wall biosynthesis